MEFDEAGLRLSREGLLREHGNRFYNHKAATVQISRKPRSRRSL